MRKQEKRTIGGVAYELTLLGTSEGSAVLAALLPRMALLGAGAEGLTRAMQGLDLEAITGPFARNTFVLGTTDKGAPTRARLSDIYEEHFAGEYERLVDWLKESVEFNFGPFLEKLRRGAAAPKEG